MQQLRLGQAKAMNLEANLGLPPTVGAGTLAASRVHPSRKLHWEQSQGVNPGSVTGNVNMASNGLTTGPSAHPVLWILLEEKEISPATECTLNGE